MDEASIRERKLGMSSPPLDIFFSAYANKLETQLSNHNWETVGQLAEMLWEAWLNKRQVFLCGNGGSAANAMHIANDLMLGLAKHDTKGIRSHALSANAAILTCLGNDVGYDYIYSKQIETYASSQDLLIALSGSGNSLNIVNAVIKANSLNMRTYGILGFTGGDCKSLVDVPIHFDIDDMQIVEDLQLVVGHMLMKWLNVKYLSDIDGAGVTCEEVSRYR